MRRKNKNSCCVILCQGYSLCMLCDSCQFGMQATIYSVPYLYVIATITEGIWHVWQHHAHNSALLQCIKELSKKTDGTKQKQHLLLINHISHWCMLNKGTLRKMVRQRIQYLVPQMLRVRSYFSYTLLRFLLMGNAFEHFLFYHIAFT